MVAWEKSPLRPSVKAFVKSRVAAYKYPRVVWFLDVLPKHGGKVLRREIRPPANVDTP
jgi:long-chain acyl-CoA synthetase